MRVTHLTRHFRERWENGDGDPVRRIQIPLHIETVNRILEESIRLQRQQTVYLRQNGEYVPRVQLAAYWHPTMHLLLKVDEKNGIAVTVVNRRRLEQHRYYDGVKIGLTD